MAEPEPHGAIAEPAVDDNGKPQTPAEKAVDDHKKKNLTYAALALGAVGVVVTLYLRRGSSSSAGAPVTPSFASSPSGVLAGGTDTGAGTGSNTDAGLSALQAQLASNQQQSLAAQAGLSSVLTRLASEIQSGAGLNQGDQARYLPRVNAGDYAKVLPTGTNVDVIGYEKSKGVYTGSQLFGGAPLYAWIKGKWVQGVSPKTAPVGTVFGTTNQFRAYEVAPGQKPPTSTPKVAGIGGVAAKAG